MLIARAPVRISFAGGGTDLPAYYQRYGGMVVSTTIDRYLYAIVSLNGRGSVQVTSSDYRTFYRQRPGGRSTADPQLALPAAVMEEIGVDRGVSIFLASEVPPGTGLGSSSAAAVALVKALSTLRNQALSKAEVAETACRIEIDRLGEPIGVQDQYAAAYGGLNAYYFGPEGPRVEPLRVSFDTRERLESRLLLFFTGESRKSSQILSEQSESSRRDVPEVIESLRAIQAAAVEMRTILEAGDVDRFGEILDDTWQRKKRLARGISNQRIDDMYDLARSRGAVGGKLTGAGGGGFLMLCCAEGRQADLNYALERRGLRQMDFHFESGGAKVLLNSLPTSEMQVGISPNWSPQ